eukprot:Seg6243.3 transcript_id=Seg6243.3/GoldUCD/mRNA.D3Y31 product="hypothetical protein" protein_id=Seg6243.3/GoldUCD/D3Y31
MRSDKQQRKGNVQTDSPTSTLKTPTKEDIEELSDKQAIVETPSRKSTAKPTSLFTDPEKQIAKDTQKSEDEIFQEIQVTSICNEISLPAVNIMPSASENDAIETGAMETDASGNKVMEITIATDPKQEIDINKRCLTSEQGYLGEKSVIVEEQVESNVTGTDELKKERTVDAASVISITTDLSKPGTAQMPSDIVNTVDTDTVFVDSSAKDIIAIEPVTMEPVTMDTVVMNDMSKDVIANGSVIMNAVATQPVTIEAGLSTVKPKDPGTAESVKEKLDTTFELVMEQLPELSLKESIAVHKRILDFSQKMLTVIENKMDDTG